MKIFILSLLVTGSIISLNAQNNIPKNDGKSFVSKVAYANKKFEPNVENDDLKMEYTRYLRIKAPSFLILKTKRVRQISKAEPFPINIDTDKSFPNNEREKSALDHYLAHIEKNIEVDVSKKQIKKTTPHNMWLARLPMLNSEQELSGIMIDNSNPKINWSDTLETIGSVYINHYTIDNDSTIKLVGESAPKKKITIDSTNTNSNPSPGESVVAKSGGKQMRYSAIIKYNKETGFIIRMDGEVKTSETLYVLGQTHDRNVQEYFVVENIEVSNK